MKTMLLIVEKTLLLAMIASMSVAATAFSHGAAYAGIGFLVVGVMSLFGSALANYKHGD